jgi:16S rRNA (cytosine967-C5)-methyltransferase
VGRGIRPLHPPRAPAAPGALSARLTRRGFSLDMETDIHFKPLVFPDPARALVGHLAAVRSHPQAYVQHLVSVHGPEVAGEVLLRNNQRPVVTLRVDAASLDVPAVAGLVAHGTAERFLVAAEGWNDAIERLIQKGALSPQDPTAAKPVRTLATLAAAEKTPAPQRVLDLCAGLGTKTLQLARAFPDAAVFGADIDSVKLQHLAARMKLVKQPNVTAWPLDKSDPQKSKFENPFDVVLVDVPCSNTGVFAKRIQSRWRWPILDRGALALLQNSLLKQGVSALAPKGCLIYSTCSIDPTENERRVAAFIAANPEFRILHQETTLPSTNATTAPHDGGYFAILSR